MSGKQDLSMASINLNSKFCEKELDFLIREAKEYACCTGLVMGISGSPNITFAPICLLPSPFPEEWFLKARNAQANLNLLMHRIAKDTLFLKKCLDKTAQTDVFIRKLMEIHDQVRVEGYAQTLTLGLFRMDYMLDSEGDRVTGLKQIEMNTIASSFGSLASGIHSLHRHILKQISAQEINYPKSHALQEFARGIVSAWRAYGAPLSIIVFAVEDDVLNFADQRILEYAVSTFEPKIKVKRYTFSQLHSLGELKDRKLFVNSEEVAVVYFRTGYVPDQYPTEESWSVRLMLERSRAIQCPNVPLQLAGMKKIQQEITRDGVIEKFLPELPEEQHELIRSLFAGQFSLDLDEEGDRACAMALANPERFVMKPQREGGGNNLYGTEVADALKNLKGPEREAYVLMEMIRPPSQPNYIIRRNQEVTAASDTIGELGIYGVILGGEEKVLVNCAAGHLLRCKENGVNEGGVAMGFGSINLPYLV